MKRILVAVDGSDHARRAIELAADIAQKYGAELILVHVINDKPLSDSARHLADVEFADVLAKQKWVNPEPVAGDSYQALGTFLKEQDSRVNAIKELLGQKILDAARDEARSHGAKQVTVVVKNGDPARAILEAGNECDANLIVMGSRGLSDFKSLMLGSVSHKVANTAPVNVITVR